MAIESDLRLTKASRASQFRRGGVKRRWDRSVNRASVATDESWRNWVSRKTKSKSRMSTSSRAAKPSKLPRSYPLSESFVIFMIRRDFKEGPEIASNLRERISRRWTISTEVILGRFPSIAIEAVIAPFG